MGYALSEKQYALGMYIIRFAACVMPYFLTGIVLTVWGLCWYKFSGKAPATLIKSANGMIFLMEQSHKLGYIFPYRESELYSLLKVFKDTGQSASRLKGIMEALTFCRYVFSITSSD